MHQGCGEVVSDIGFTEMCVGELDDTECTLVIARKMVSRGGEDEE